MLKLENVDVRYGGVHALRGVSLEVNKGEIVAILGANGAGKTTTLRAISGVVTPVSGEIAWEGKRLNRLAPEEIVRLGVAHVPEGRLIFPDLTVEENLLVGAYTRTTRSAVRAEIANVFDRFSNLGKRRSSLGRNLSGGEQQMLAIARAMMSSPRVLLLDEPSMGLAPLVVQEVFRIITALNEEGVTIVLVEQNARMALRTADRAYVLENGCIALSGRAADLRQNRDVQRSYLGHAGAHLSHG